MAIDLSTQDSATGDLPRTLEEARALFEVGQQDLESGSLDAAKATFLRVIESGLFVEWASFFLGRTHQRAGNLRAARDAFAKAVAVDPGMFWGRYELLATSRTLGETPESLAGQVAALLDCPFESLAAPHVAELEAVADQLWNAPQGREQAAALLARLPEGLLAQRSRDRLNRQAAEKSEPTAGEAAAPSSTDLPGSEEEATALLVRARQDFERGQHDAAGRAFERLVASGFQAQWGHFYLGRIRSGEADEPRALAAYEAALTVDPGHFWAHYERLLLAPILGTKPAALAGWIEAIAGLKWETIHGTHVRELERIAHLAWDADIRGQAALLFARLWPSADLTQLALVRLIESDVDRKAAAGAADRLESYASLDEPALRVLSVYHQKHGDVSREISTLERAFANMPKDFQTWLALIRAYAKAGNRERAFAVLEQGKNFAVRQRLFVTLIANLELGDLDAAFLAFRDHCRIYGEVPKFPGIRIAYLLGDAFDTIRRDEVVAILTSSYPEDTDVALVRVNAAMRDQRWDEARALFDRFFAGTEHLPQPVRLARIDILAYSGKLEEAADLLRRERVDGVVPTPFLRSTIRILSELDRWDEVFEAGLASLTADHSFQHFLSPIIRASRKCGRGEELFQALLALPRPLKRQQNDALYAVMEDLAEQGCADILDRVGDLHVPYEREHRIQLKLRGNAGPAKVEKDLCIYFCADKNYLLPALVSLTALAMSNVSITRRAVFHLVVDQDVVPLAQNWGGAIARRLGLSLEVTDASTIVSSADRLRTSYGIFTGGQQLALAAYYRIFFARWLVDQKRYSQALYIDADTIVRSGLDELFLLGRETPLLARYETDRPEVRHASEVHKLKGRYFNSGVLRFDLENPGLPALLDKAIAAAIDPEVLLIFQDQCALNIAFDGSMAELPERFNYFNPPDVSGDGISATDAVIVHFLDRPKPWDSLYRRRAREWFEWYDLVETLRLDAA